jgi:hypothetical protein
MNGEQCRLVLGVLYDSQNWDVCLWLRRNGIEPRLVPDDAQITVTHACIEYERWDFSAMDCGGFPVREQVTTPLLVPLPSGGFR